MLDVDVAIEIARKRYPGLRSFDTEVVMSTLAQSLGTIKRPWQWIAIGGGILLVWGVATFPRHQRGTPAAYHSAQLRTEPYVPSRRSIHKVQVLDHGEADISPVSVAAPQQFAAPERKIEKTAAVSMVVQHPSQIADQITALAENLGGYLVIADSGGQNATTGSLTIRVPAARFEQARNEIRKLGLRVESEKIEAQDVSRQYVDQDASIRNLRAEEAQYLAIMKQASTVKDMLAVSEQLSGVRGQIEQQQAEFNALSRQIETVAIAVSMRTESEAQALWPNWRPAYQLTLALRDGLESLGIYATAMTTIVFYLPAILLWAATILGTIAIGTKMVRWVGHRWFGWNTMEPTEAK